MILALHANLPAMQARRLRRDIELRPDIAFSPDLAYELTLAETGDKTQAQQAHYAAVRAQVKAAQTKDLPDASE